jgi:hypothetical protein
MWKADEMEIRLDDRTTSEAETRALGIEVGDLIAWDPRTVVRDTGYVKSQHLDDKAGVAVMLAALRALAESGLMPAQRTTFHFRNREELTRLSTTVSWRTKRIANAPITKRGERITRTSPAIQVLRACAVRGPSLSRDPNASTRSTTCRRTP